MKDKIKRVLRKNLWEILVFAALMFGKTLSAWVWIPIAILVIWVLVKNFIVFFIRFQ